MPVSMTEKQEIIQQLLASKTKSYQAEVKLLLKRMPEEANEVKTHGKELSRKIDRLIAQTMSEWMADSAIVINNVKSANIKIQRSINDIRNDVNIAKNVVKIVGLIDDIVKIAAAIA